MSSDNRIVFHYNLKHNQDQSVPPWVLKHRGQTYYCWNVRSEVPFDTKNTPENPHTKGSLMLHGELKLLSLESTGHVIDAIIIP